MRLADLTAHHCERPPSAGGPGITMSTGALGRIDARTAAEAGFAMETALPALHRAVRVEGGLVMSSPSATADVFGGVATGTLEPRAISQFSSTAAGHALSSCVVWDHPTGRFALPVGAWLRDGSCLCVEEIRLNGNFAIGAYMGAYMGCVTPWQ